MKIKITHQPKDKVEILFRNNANKEMTAILSEEQYRKAFNSLDGYQIDAKSTCTGNSYSYTYLSAGLYEEVGEFFSKIAKMIRKGDLPVYLTREDILALDEETRHLLLKEAGDILWFVAVLSDWCGWSLSEVANTNIEKLLDRKKRNKIIGEGDNR